MQPPKEVTRKKPVQLKLLNQHPIDNATSVVAIKLLAALTQAIGKKWQACTVKKNPAANPPVELCSSCSCLENAVANHFTEKNMHTSKSRLLT